MRYRILGSALAEDGDGRRVAVGGARLRALLTALALRVGRIVTPDTLIDEVWAADPPLDAPAALQALVGRLRRTVGKDAVTSHPGGYRLTATQDDVDLYVFEGLVRQGTAALDHDDPATAARDLDDALALWHGPALADLPGRTAAARPEALRLEATRARAEARLRLGHAQDAVPELKELTAAHPYDEPLHALLIRALRDTGRSADALAAYETARRALADGLGTDPGPELRALHQALLDQPAAPSPVPQPRNGNLRPRLTSFVGREPELGAVRSELHRARLVTLTGSGGSGKTRLAEEAAAGLPQAWLVELAPLDRPEAVPGAVVSALGLRETVLMATEMASQQDDPVALLVEHCAPRSQLLILDNCEHVIGAAAALAETLLTRCPGLTILATSREPLGVPGESVRPVEPLVPDQAHRLFAERAAAVRPDAAAVLQDTEAVGEICRRLDGLPLAIELAAARLRLLSPRQIADRLDDRFRLLTSGSRTVLPRQQTLRAVVDWSWELLDERERTVLREVSVFAGGWDLAAAEAVCTGPVADLLGALVDKSLIVAAPCERDGSDGMRYRMLETIHEYAVERAGEAPEAHLAAERRHRAWVRALVEQAEPLLRSAGQLPWISRLETELDNIRAALDRALTAGDEAEAGAIALAMGWFCSLRNYRREGVEWIDRVLRLGAALDAVGGGAPAARARAGHGPGVRAAGRVVSPLGSPDPIDAFLAAPDGESGHPLHALRMDLRMLALFLMADSEPRPAQEDLRFRKYIARVRAYFEPGGPDAARMPGLTWPLINFYLRDSTGVRDMMGRAVANCRTYGGDWELAVLLMFRAHIVIDVSGRLEGVDDDLAELQKLSRSIGDRWIRAQVCSARGEAAAARSRFEDAEKEYAEALRLAYEVGAYTESPFLLARLAEIAYRSGDRSAALISLDEASTAADRYGVVDTRAFLLVLRAHMALDVHDVARARELCDAAGVESGFGTPPPQFTVGLKGLDALIKAAESGPEHGLPILADAVRQAVEWRCAEWTTAELAETAARLVSALGDHARAVRLLAASEDWREGHPRPQPGGAVAERTEALARTALGPARYTAERTRGAALTPEDAQGELADAVRSHPAGQAR
ncbi:BTAD domain-containing putative transcriptional regulator [Streptomyces sp. GESEQ-35]|uniref:BTAD domain-containing putative transcriptional regulator n=1 Tax=Streptomyces sp. GESEQ-35 TaxID=2812657 RepID=UPI001B32E513|nr:BTAD domain-containing putative transcriptional regulator [Streptomyces sp. GESEQ-35]